MYFRKCFTSCDTVQIEHWNWHKKQILTNGFPYDFKRSLKVFYGQAAFKKLFTKFFHNIGWVWLLN